MRRVWGRSQRRWAKDFHGCRHVLGWRAAAATAAKGLRATAGGCGCLKRGVVRCVARCAHVCVCVLCAQSAFLCQWPRVRLGRLM